MGSKCLHGEEYAFDFDMPDGSPVAAAHDGVVEAIRGDSKNGGCNSAFVNDANYVLLDHGDGKTSLYLHLMTGSLTVKAGDQVRQGDILAESDHSGFSCGSHLHFQVQDKAVGCQAVYCQSVPVYFDDLGAEGTKLVLKTPYKSGNVTKNQAPSNNNGNDSPAMGQGSGNGSGSSQQQPQVKKQVQPRLPPPPVPAPVPAPARPGNPPQQAKPKQQTRPQQQLPPPPVPVPAPAPPPPQQNQPTPTLQLDRAFTTDGTTHEKTTFSPGDNIWYVVSMHVTNGPARATSVHFRAAGPRVIYDTTSSPSDVNSGYQAPYGPATIPSDAPSGTYTLTANVTFNGSTTTRTTTFTVTNAAQVEPKAAIPAAPTDVHIDQFGPTGLRWIDNSNNEQGFHIYQNGKLVATEPANSTQLHGSLVGSCSDTLVVGAFNSAGESKSTPVSYCTAHA